MSLSTYKCLVYVRVSLCVIVLSMFTDFWKGLSDVKMDEQKDVSSCVSNALLKTVWMSGLQCVYALLDVPRPNRIILHHSYN